MNDNEKIELLEKLKKLILENSYYIQNEGTEGREELKNKVIESLGTKVNGYICLNSDQEIIKYFESINRGSNYLDNLPLVLKKAIEIYSGSNYRDINNGFLRKNNGLSRGKKECCSCIDDYSSFEMSNYYKEGIVDALDFLMNQNQLQNGMLLYRGCSIKQFNKLGIMIPEELFLMKGKKFVECGYTSTTGMLDGRFIDESPIVMVISVSPGVHVLNFIGSSLALSEGEILIEREVEYTINNVEIINGKFFVYTDVVAKEKKRVEFDDIKLTDNDENIKLAKNAVGEDYLEDDYLDDILFENSNSKIH